MENDDKKTQQEEPKMPEPQEVNQKPEVDMSNEIKKGGEVPEKK